MQNGWSDKSPAGRLCVDVLFEMLLVVLFTIGLGTGDGFISNLDECAVSGSRPSCTCREADLICSRKSLTHLPTFKATFQEYRNIYLDGNQISVIGNDAFTDLVTADEVYIDLSNSYSYMRIEDGAFASLGNVTLSLNLDNTRIPLDFGESLGHVRIVRLTMNQAKSIDSSTMFSLGNTLETLALGIASLSEWPKELRFLRALKNLTVFNETMMTIPDDAFHGFEHRLRVLQFINTDLIRFPDAVCRLEKLESLTMSQHRSSLHDSPVPYCQKPMMGLQNFTLHSVGLSEMPNIFQTFPRVVNLKVSGNKKLKYIAENSVANKTLVKKLSLANNGLTQVPRSLRLLRNLVDLDLSFNRISTIENNDLDSMPPLQHLRLSGNPIVYISDYALLPMSHIQYVNLSDTQLTVIPRAILKLPYSLKLLGLRNNTIECSCDMHWILKWPVLNSVSILGNCQYSKETIQTFINHQLKECQD